jgi:hypothetical protein
MKKTSRYDGGSCATRQEKRRALPPISGRCRMFGGGAVGWCSGGGAIGGGGRGAALLRCGRSFPFFGSR